MKKYLLLIAAMSLPLVSQADPVPLPTPSSLQRQLQTVPVLIPISSFAAALTEIYKVLSLPVGVNQSQVTGWNFRIILSGTNEPKVSTTVIYVQ